MLQNKKIQLEQSNDKKKPKVNQQQITVSNLLKEFRTSVDQLNSLLGEEGETQKIKNVLIEKTKELNDKEFEFNSKLLTLKKESSNEVRSIQMKCENKIRDITQDMEALKVTNNTLNDKMQSMDGKMKIMGVKLDGLSKECENLKEQMAGRQQIIETTKINLEESLKSFDELNNRKQDLEMELSNKKVKLAMENEDKERTIDVLIELSKKCLKKKADVKSAINAIMNADTKKIIMEKMSETGYIIS